MFAPHQGQLLNVSETAQPHLKHSAPVTPPTSGQRCARPHSEQYSMYRWTRCPQMQRCSRAHAGGRRRLRALIPGDCRIHDALDEITVFQSSLGGGIGHVVTITDERVGVGLEHQNPPVLGDSEIEPGVIP